MEILFLIQITGQLARTGGRNGCWWNKRNWINLDGLSLQHRGAFIGL